MGYLDPDFGMICVPKRRWRMRVIFGLLAVLLLVSVLSAGVACGLAAVAVVAAFGQAIGEALGSLFSLAAIFIGGAWYAFLYGSVVAELLALLATGQIVPFVLRVARLLCGS